MNLVKVAKTQKLLKILIGAAWIDGVIEPAERVYLRKVAHELNLVNDPEIEAILSELKPVTSQECYQWLDEYTKENQNLKDYNDLLEKISGLIYSDGYLDIRETKLIEKLQLCDPSLQTCTPIWDQVLGKIQELYKLAVMGET